MTSDIPVLLARDGVIARIVFNLVTETDKLAKRLADGPTFAYGQTKALLRGSLGRTMHDQMAAEGDAFRACMGTADFAEGVGAFLGKRAATFKGS